MPTKSKREIPNKVAYLYQFLILCSPVCLKQPRTSFPFHEASGGARIGNFDIIPTEFLKIVENLRTGELSRIDQWVKLRKKGEKWNGTDGISVPVCLVRVHTASDYTRGEWYTMKWNFDYKSKIVYKK